MTLWKMLVHYKWLSSVLYSCVKINWSCRGNLSFGALRLCQWDKRCISIIKITPQCNTHFIGCFHCAVSIRVNMNSTYRAIIAYKQSKPDLEEKSFIEITGAPRNVFYSLSSYRLTLGSVYRCSITFPAVEQELRKPQYECMIYFL